MIALFMDYYTTQGVNIMNTKHTTGKKKQRTLGRTMIECLSIFIVQTIPPIIKTTINEIGINL